MSRRRFSLIGFVTVLGVLLALTFAAFLPAPAHAQTAAPLTNDEVIKMVQAKLPDSVVVAKIRTSPCKFDTSPDTLIKLKQMGVSDEVLEAMAELGSPAATATWGPATHKPPLDPNDPLAEHDPGIYYLQQNPGDRLMTQLQPTAYSRAKTSGMFASIITSGIAKTKWKAVVRGEQASVRITEPKATFYFYFEQRHGTLSYAGIAIMFGGLSTPSQFMLVRLESKKDHRELMVGEAGILGSSSGTREKDIVEFDFKKVAPGIYEVSPRNNLEPGEYCFFNTGQAVGPGIAGMPGPVAVGVGDMLFDFGINPAK